MKLKHQITKTVSVIMSVAMLLFCVPSGIISETVHAVTQTHTISYVNVDDSTDIVEQTVSGTSVKLPTKVNNKQAEVFYSAQDTSTAESYFPRRTYTLSTESDTENIYVKYTDTTVLFHNYGGSSESSGDGLSPITAVTSGGSLATAITTNYQSAKSNTITTVLMGGASNLTGDQNNIKFQKKDVSFAGLIKSDKESTYMSKTVIANSVNALPVYQLCKANTTNITNTFENVNYGSKLYLESPTGAKVAPREIYSPNNLNIDNIDVKVDSDDYKWLLLDNKEGKVNIGNNVNFYNKSNELVNDFKIYKCNYLADGLTLNFVDTNGNILKTENLAVSNTSGVENTVCVGNKNGIYFYFKDPQIQGATTFTLNGTEVTPGTTATNEFVDTFSGTASKDVLNITVTGNLGVATVNYKYGDKTKLGYTGIATDDVGKYVVLDELLDERQVNYYTYNSKNYFPNQKIYIDDATTIDVDANLVDSDTIYIYENYGGDGSSDTNSGLSPLTAVLRNNIAYETALKYSAQGKKVVVVYMGKRGQSNINTYNAYINTGTTLKESTSDISFATDTDTTCTNTQKSALYSIKTNGGKFYTSAPDIVYTSSANGICYNSSIILQNTELALYNNVKFKDIGLYYGSRTAPQQTITCYENKYSLTTENLLNNSNINFVNAEGVYNNYTVTFENKDDSTTTQVEKRLKKNTDGSVTFEDLPTLIDNVQADRFQNGSTVKFAHESITVPASSIENYCFTIDYYPTDKQTYYICTHSSLGNNDNDGLSALSPVKDYFQIIKLCKKAKYTDKDSIRIVLMSYDSLARSSSFSDYFESGFSYINPSTIDSYAIDDSRGDDEGDKKNTLGFTPHQYTDNTDYGYTEDTVPAIEITGKYHNINFNTVFQMQTLDMYLYNDLYIHDLCLDSAIGKGRIYTQGCNFTAGQNVTTDFTKAQGTEDYDCDLQSGILVGYPNISIMAGTFGREDRKYAHDQIRYNPVITVESGVWGRVLGGSRKGPTGVQYSDALEQEGKNPFYKSDEDFNPKGQTFNVTINIKDTADLSLVCGGQTESIFDGNSTVNISGHSNVTHLVGGTLGYNETVFNYDKVYNPYMNIYNGNIKINISDSPTIDKLYGGCVGRKTTSIASYGTIDININGGDINYLWGGSGAGIVYGDININMDKGNVGELYGGGSGKSPYTDITSIKTGDYALTEMGSVKPYGTEHPGKVTIKMTGDSVLKDLFGGSDGYDYNDERYNDIAQIKGGTDIVISDNSIIHGNVYGGGDGFKFSDKIALIDGQTLVTVKDKAQVLGNVYGGGNNGKIVGGCTVNIEDAYVKGTVFGAGAESGISESSILNILNHSVIDGCAYGGGEDGPVEKSTTVTVSDSTINSNIYAGGKNGIVAYNTSITIDGDSVLQDVFGGGYGNQATVCSNVSENSTEEYTTNILIKSGKINGSVFGGGEMANVGQNYLNVDDSTKTGSYDKVITNVKVTGGTIIGSVYGGGRGEKENFTEGNIYGHTKVYILGGTIKKNILGGSDYGSVFANMSAEPGKSGNITGNLDKDASFFEIWVSIRPIYQNINIGTNDTSTVNGNVYGGGFNGKTYANVAISFSDDDLLQTISDNTQNDSYDIKVNSIYGDGNVAQVRGYRLIFLQSFNSAPDKDAVMLNKGNEHSYSTNCYKFSSIQRADTIYSINSHIQLSGDYDTTVTNDKNQYSCANIGAIYMKQNSTFCFHKEIKYIGGLYSDVDSTTDYLKPDSQTGTNDSIIYYENADGYDSKYLSSYQKGNFTAGDSNSYSSDNYNTIILDKEVFLKVQKSGTTGTKKEDYGCIDGVFTLAVVTDEKNRTGGDYVAASTDSKGTFVSLSDEDGDFGTNLDYGFDYLKISDSDRPLFSKDKIYHLWYARYSYSVTYYSDSYFTDDEQTTFNDKNTEYSVSSGIAIGGTSIIPTVSPSKNKYIFNSWYYYKYVGGDNNENLGDYVKDSDGVFSYVGDKKGNYTREPFTEDVVISSLRSADVVDNTGELDRENNLNVYPYFWPHQASNMYYTSFSYNEPWTMNFYTRFRDPNSTTKPYKYLTSEQIADYHAFVYYGDAEPSFLEITKKNSDGTMIYEVESNKNSTVSAYGDKDAKWINCKIANIKAADIKKKVYVMFSATYNGTAYYSAIKERTLNEILHQVVSYQIPASDSERDICSGMIGYFEALEDYKGSSQQEEMPESDYPDAVNIESSKSNLSGTTSFEEQTEKPTYYLAAKSGEPWGLQLSCNMSGIDLSTCEDYGVAIYEDRGYTDSNGKFHFNYCNKQQHLDEQTPCGLNKMQVSDFLNDKSTIIYSKSDNNFTTKSINGQTFATAYYIGRTYVYQMNIPVHYTFYYKDSSGYHFMTPRVCDMYDVIKKVTTNEFCSTETQTLAKQMCNLFDVVYKYEYGVDYNG